MARELFDDEDQAQAVPAEATETTEQSAEEVTEGEQTSTSADASTTDEAEDTTEADWAAFTEAVEGALAHEGRDLTTGEMTPAGTAPALKAYRDLKGSKQKKLAREHLQGLMSKNMTSGDFPAARSHLEILKAIEAGGGATRETAPREPVNPTEAHVGLIAAIMLAPNLVTVPEGVAGDWAAQAQAKAKELGPQIHAYRDWIAANGSKPEEEREAAPEVDPIVLAAAKIAAGRAASIRKASAGKARPTVPGVQTERRDIGEHIRQAFENVDAGTFLSVGEIQKYVSTEYGEDHPSPGAIAARLFPKSGKCNLTFVTPAEQGKKGAIKV